MIIRNGNTFHLSGKNSSYIMVLNECKNLLHYHFGRKLSDKDYSGNVENDPRVLMCCDENGFFLGTALQEYPSYGYTDMHNPAYTAKMQMGTVYRSLHTKNTA